MFFQLLFIHLFKPFLKYNQATSPLPAHVSPRKLCTQAASLISKLLRLYKRTYGLRQICNVAVYIAHSACTIHLLNLPEKTAKRDIIHGVKHLEEIAEGWLCARRTLGTLSVLTRQWEIELPEEAAAVLARTEAKYGPLTGDEMASPRSGPTSPQTVQPVLPSVTAAKNSHPSPKTAQAQHRPPARGVPANTPAAQAQRPSPISSYSSPPVNDVPSTSRNQVYTAAAPLQQTFRQPWESLETTLDPPQPPVSAILAPPANLVQESQDWWLREATLANEFENWTGPEPDPSLMTETLQGINFGTNGPPYDAFGNGNMNGNGSAYGPGQGNPEWYGG